jgi:hypothetical protein
LSRSPTAGGAALEAHAEERNPTWLEDNGVVTVRNTATW